MKDGNRSGTSIEAEVEDIAAAAAVQLAADATSGAHHLSAMD
jgi:hypothetical protein